VRSLHAELDYSKKDATRHIVQNNLCSDTLRKKLLRNLEGVRKNKPILNSEVGSIRSIMSRMSKTSARASQAPDAYGAAQGRLSKIEEQEIENMGPYKCECCQKDVEEEADIGMAQEISKQLACEDNLKKAYNDFRIRKGLDPVIFSEQVS